MRDGVVRPSATTQVTCTRLRYQHSPAAQFRAGVVRSCTAAGSQNTASRLYSSVTAHLTYHVVELSATARSACRFRSDDVFAANLVDGVVRPSATTQVAGTLLRYQHSPTAQFRTGVVRSCTAAGSQNTASRLYCSLTAHLSSNVVELSATARFHRVFWVNYAVADYYLKNSREQHMLIS